MRWMLVTTEHSVSERPARAPQGNAPWLDRGSVSVFLRRQFPPTKIMFRAGPSQVGETEFNARPLLHPGTAGRRRAFACGTPSELRRSIVCAVFTWTRAWRSRTPSCEVTPAREPQCDGSRRQALTSAQFIEPRATQWRDLHDRAQEPHPGRATAQPVEQLWLEAQRVGHALLRQGAGFPPSLYASGGVWDAASIEDAVSR